MDDYNFWSAITGDDNAIYLAGYTKENSNNQIGHFSHNNDDTMIMSRIDISTRTYTWSMIYEADDDDMEMPMAVALNPDKSKLIVTAIAISQDSNTVNI